MGVVGALAARAQRSILGVVPVRKFSEVLPGVHDREYLDAVRAHLIPDTKPALYYLTYLLDFYLWHSPPQVRVIFEQAHVPFNGTTQALGGGI